LTLLLFADVLACSMMFNKRLQTGISRPLPC
jgi:hypothetical protein